MDYSMMTSAQRREQLKIKKAELLNLQAEEELRLAHKHKDNPALAAMILNSWAGKQNEVRRLLGAKPDPDLHYETRLEYGSYKANLQVKKRKSRGSK